MEMTLESRFAQWDGASVVSRFHRASGSWIFIHLHDDTLGPYAGGTRMKHYPRLSDAVLDGQRLAEGMTSKWAAIDMPFGGGKAVIATPPTLDAEARQDLLATYAHLLAGLRGAYFTGEDMGTTSDDLSVIAQRAPYVLGFDRDGNKLDPSPYTAHGVDCGLRAAVAQTFGDDDLRGRRVLIQGIGHVGWHLANKLAADGVELVVSDVDAGACRRAAEQFGADIVTADEVYDVECDVYAPCAIGATLNEDTIARLRCRVVAGSANNQLASTEDAERLHARGIVYAPDYVINAGGAMSFALLLQEGEVDLMASVGKIGGMIADILREAAEANESPVRAAQRRVDERLSH